MNDIFIKETRSHMKKRHHVRHWPFYPYRLSQLCNHGIHRLFNIDIIIFNETVNTFTYSRCTGKAPLITSLEWITQLITHVITLLVTTKQFMAFKWSKSTYLTLKHFWWSPDTIGEIPICIVCIFFVFCIVSIFFFYLLGTTVQG